MEMGNLKKKMVFNCCFFFFWFICFCLLFNVSEVILRVSQLVVFFSGEEHKNKDSVHNRTSHEILFYNEEFFFSRPTVTAANKTTTMIPQITSCSHKNSKPFLNFFPHKDRVTNIMSYVLFFFYYLVIQRNFTCYPWYRQDFSRNDNYNTVSVVALRE